VFAQSLLLGVVHLACRPWSTLLVTVAGVLSAWFATRPLWMRMQRWLLGTAFGALAVCWPPRRATRASTEEDRR